MEEPKLAPIPIQICRQVMSALVELPVEVLENATAFLDGKSVGRLSQTNGALRKTLETSMVWKTQVAAQFGIQDSAFPAQSPCIWRSIFANLMWDATFVAQAASAHDAIQVVESAPVYAMASSSAKSIRREILLMEALRRFPTSSSLVHLYATLLRQ
ncbi:unnamed protein product [Aphanomyces euteiches]|uniref:F-box domain-containing protein n=1 Tax=Aphanomyces euteiches TaxID=100861 RepID=A0A6G0WXK5_9STRA|nr:hypothetical protein Ae201684_010582 [Aphanomyces euteiches]KAH9090089.1 hypothetical protein Ae201684P_014843 [Aphanomyces euteiches]KAH9145401.1 hypothetical protein AeRB84_010754 [Aphanomyces euteiches]